MHERLKALNKILRFHRRNNPKDSIIDEIQADADKIKGIISKGDYKKISVAQAAEDAGLIDWYDTVYSHLSGAVHSSVSSLQEAIDRDAEENIKALKNEPEINEYDFLYTTALEAMMYADVAVSRTFNLDINAFVKEVSEKIREFQSLLK